MVSLVDTEQLLPIPQDANKSAGLGSMGFGMCSNIHSKIKPEDHLSICDINQAALDRFIQESKGQAKVEILKTPKDVAKQCVRGTIQAWLEVIS
jgi:hypothetical protein